MARLPVAFVFLALGGVSGALVTNHALQGQATAPAPVYPKELASYRDVVKRVLPAVVSVEAFPKAVAKNSSSPQRRRPSIGPMPGIPEEFRKFFEDQDGFQGFQQFEESPRPRHSFGSGFIIDPKGTILTNYHVVNGAGRVEIQLKDGRTFSSTDIKGDPKNDLAIVHIKATTPLPYLELGDSDAMEIGDRVLAVGAPFGLTGSVTTGIVSAKGRSGLSGQRTVYEDYLQTDAAINPGNSGGPLVNLEGRVIGINTAIKTENGGFMGVGLAIASNVAKNIVDQLVRDGVVHRGYLGVTVQGLSPDVAAQMGIKQDGGAIVTQVVKGTPAAKAGLKPGDVITSLDGKPVKDSRELQHLVGGLPVHKSVELAIIRDETPKVLRVTIEEQPNLDRMVSNDQAREPAQADQEEFRVDSIGLTLADLTSEEASRLGFDEDVQGAVVTEVAQGSIAADSRLQRGMVIAEINKKSVKTAAAARKMLQQANLAKGVLLKVHFAQGKSGMGTTYIVLRGETADK
jgi:serine protease Do